jgi:hypothetical protein
VAGKPGLRRQEDRGDRQRRHRGHPAPLAVGAGRTSDHAAALADLSDLGVEVQQDRRFASFLDADIIITATGLQLQALGGAEISLDGEKVDHRERFVYKAHMLEDVPNLFWCVGYTNASWTLRADITARATAKLLAHMASHGCTHAYPHLGNEPMAEKPSWDIAAGYVKRSAHQLPKSGTRRPWNVRQNYLADALDYRFDRIEEAMEFGRAADRAPVAG